MNAPLCGAAAESSAQAELPYFIASLLKGPLYQAQDPIAWSELLSLKAHIEDYIRTLGFTLIIDPNEGYAYFKSRLDEEAEGARKPPRLVARRALSFNVSLLLALLRKRLSEFDAQGGATRLVLSRTDIVEMVRVFLPATNNEVKLISSVESSIHKIIDLGFLRPLATVASASRADATYEVDRILKAFIDAQWLSTLNERLAAYRAHLEENTSSATENTENDDE